MATKRRPKPPAQRLAPPLRPTITALAPADVAPGNVSLTIAEWIVEQVVRGAYPPHAAAACGITGPELTAWTREGVIVLNRLANGADWNADFTPEQQDLAVFADNLNRALGRQLTRTTLAVSSAIAGGSRVETIRETIDPATGDVTERKRTVEKLAPSLDAAKWMLEKMAPEVFGQKATLNVNVVDVSDTDDQRSILEARMEGVLERMFPDAIEATSSEPEPKPAPRRRGRKATP